MSYQPIFPATLAADDPLRRFVADFYATSDDAARTDDWVDFFLPDAEVRIGNDGAAGKEGRCFVLLLLPSCFPLPFPKASRRNATHAPTEIRNFRVHMWDKVAARKLWKLSEKLNTMQTS